MGIVINDKQSAFTVAADYIKTPLGVQNLVIRPIVHALKFTELFESSLAGTVKGPRELLRLADHLFQWVGYPKKIRDFDRSVVKLKNSLASSSIYKIISKVSKLYINSCLVVGLIADGLKNLQAREMIHLAAPYVSVLEKIGFLGNIAFLLFSLHSIKKQVKILIATTAWSPQFKLALITLVGKVCLVALAVFGIITYFGTTLLSPWLPLAFAVGGLICSLSCHFYEKIHVDLLPQKDV